MDAAHGVASRCSLRAGGPARYRAAQAAAHGLAAMVPFAPVRDFELPQPSGREVTHQCAKEL